MRAGSSLAIGRLGIRARLEDSKTLELGMAEVEGLVVAGVEVGGAKRLGLRPGGKGVWAFPAGCEA
jgi:hypothetical protein